jgi:hypothetical protein
VKKQISILFFILTSGILAEAQAPDVVPYGQPDPLELTPANIIFFFVLPVLLFIALIIIRKKKKNKKNS